MQQQMCLGNADHQCGEIAETNCFIIYVVPGDFVAGYCLMLSNYQGTSSVILW